MTTKAKGTRVPRALAPFDTYIRTVLALLFSTNPATGNLWWVDLLLSSAEATQANNFLTQWYTGNPASPGVYEKHINPDTKGKNTRKNVVKLIKDFSTFFNPLLIRMSGSALITTNARTTLHIAEPNPTRTRHEDPIMELCFAKHKDMGGGTHELLCATAHDSKRPSLAATADGVMLSYSIVDLATLRANARTAVPVGGAAVPDPPASPDECDKQKHFPGSKIILALGAGNKGKTLYAYLQWNDSKHPDRMGPAGDLITIVI